MKRIGIEGLVRWAVLDEWPKSQERDAAPAVRSAWQMVSDVGEVGTIIDVNRYGVVIDASRLDDPHPDALALADVVAEFRDEADAIGERQEVRFAEIDPEWLVGDLVWRIAVEQGDDVARRAQRWLTERAMRAIEGVAVAAGGALTSRLPMRAILVRRAVLGAPAWQVGPVAWGHLMRANGSVVWRRRVRVGRLWSAEGDVLAWGEAEVDAPLVNGRRPADAYPVEVMTPDPTDVLAARAAYVVWRAALRMVGEMVGPRLVDHVLVDDGAPSLPWIAPREAPRRVLSASGATPGRSEGPMKENRRKRLT